VITENGQLALPGASDISPVTERLVDDEGSAPDRSRARRTHNG
jgi:hypothetical protein